MKAWKRSSILIVEDHNVVRIALRSLLQEAFPGARILDTATGREGIAMAREHRPKAIVMDVRLPDMSGIRATRLIRRFLPTTAIVMCSLSDTAGNRAAAMRAGADAWVKKDEAAEVLVPTIHRLRSPNGRTTQTAESGEGAGPIHADAASAPERYVA